MPQGDSLRSCFKDLLPEGTHAIHSCSAGALPHGEWKCRIAPGDDSEFMMPRKCQSDWYEGTNILPHGMRIELSEDFGNLCVSVL